MDTGPERIRQKSGQTSGSASERAFELLIESAMSLEGLASAAAQELRGLFDKEGEITGEDIVKAVLSAGQETEPVDAEDQRD